MKYLMLGLLFLTINAHAGDQWLCTEESSQRSGDVIKSCGVGIGFDENGARLDALDHAKAEFHQICQSSSDCVGHYIHSEPKRTSCEPYGDLYKCYRLVEFTIKENIKQAKAIQANGGLDCSNIPWDDGRRFFCHGDQAPKN